ncbi:hypothetical protein BV22DRAFT_1134719 [Leucogyrophana mollusca]|uniref:Uncharacterized protein n=1 Tax=Leucogyrophana mollusca TaxID=85980 RepID=A0ACB8AY03_9AGAM|nr:hypothetical protein BV22DRAFT_1134719 [Leucogyrophana mollusca]
MSERPSRSTANKNPAKVVLDAAPKRRSSAQKKADDTAATARKAAVAQAARDKFQKDATAIAAAEDALREEDTLYGIIPSSTFSASSKKKNTPKNPSQAKTSVRKYADKEPSADEHQGTAEPYESDGNDEDFEPDISGEESYLSDDLSGENEMSPEAEKALKKKGTATTKKPKKPRERSTRDAINAVRVVPPMSGAQSRKRKPAEVSNDEGAENVGHTKRSKSAHASNLDTDWRKKLGAMAKGSTSKRPVLNNKDEPGLIPTAVDHSCSSSRTSMSRLTSVSSEDALDGGIFDEDESVDIIEAARKSKSTAKKKQNQVTEQPTPRQDGNAAARIDAIILIRATDCGAFEGRYKTQLEDQLDVHCRFGPPVPKNNKEYSRSFQASMIHFLSTFKEDDGLLANNSKHANSWGEIAHPHQQKRGSSVGSKPLKNLNASDLPFTEDADHKTWDGLIRTLLDWAGTVDDPFGTNEHPDLAERLQELWDLFFPHLLLDISDYPAIKKLFGKNTITRLEKFFKDPKYRNDAKTRAEYVRSQLPQVITGKKVVPFLYADSVKLTKSWQSPLLLNIFAWHVKRVGDAFQVFGRPSGALAMSAAALQRALTLYKTGNSEKDDKDPDVKGKCKPGIDFDNVWGLSAQQFTKFTDDTKWDRILQDVSGINQTSRNVPVRDEEYVDDTFDIPLSDKEGEGEKDENIAEDSDKGEESGDQRD